MMGIFHRALIEVGGNADVVMWAENETGACTLQELPDCLNFLRRGFLLGNHVIQAKDHKRVRISQYAFVDRQSLSGLIDALIDSDGLSRRFAHGILEAH